VAPSYAAVRSELAKKMGLGRKPKAAEPVKQARKKAG
jgi:predicted transcriptional regulator